MPQKIAYLGPPGTFSQAAVIGRFGAECEQLACSTIDDVFAAVAQSQADCGLVPIENSTEGPVNNTQDCLIETELSIVGEEVINIEHNLVQSMRNKWPLGDCFTQAVIGAVPELDSGQLS